MVHLIRYLSRSPDETRDLGRKLGRVLSGGVVVALRGDLGSGKSVLARGILDGLGVVGDMPSPSFVIAASYEGRVQAHHIDLYRLESARDALDAGIEELLFSDAVCIVEWAEKLEGYLPEARIDVDLRAIKETVRLIGIGPGDTGTVERLAPFAKALLRLGG